MFGYRNPWSVAAAGGLFGVIGVLLLVYMERMAEDARRSACLGRGGRYGLRFPLGFVAAREVTNAHRRVVAVQAVALLVTSGVLLLRAVTMPT